MDESLAMRMEEIAVHVREEYAQKKQPFFLDPEFSYKPIEDVADLSARVFPDSGEVIVSKYKPEEAVGAVALLIVSTFYIVNKIRETGTGTLSVIFLMIWISAISYFIVRSLNKSPRLIFNKENIWLYKPEKNILWKYIAAGFIKTVVRGESDEDHYLVIHYYEPDTDDFHKLEMDLGNLNYTKEEIAGYFEFFLKQNNVKAG